MGLAAVPVGGDGAWQSYSQRPSPTGAKGTGGTGGPGCGAGGRRRGLAELFTATYPHWCEGHRRDRRARPGCWWAATGPGRAIHSDLPPLVRRAPEGPEGQAAVPVGGDGAWPGFEATRRAKLAARTARGRAAAHGHNQQPGPTAHHAAARQGRRASTQLVHVLDTVERPSIQRSRAATTSATWTALRAAPLRRLSPETTRMRPRLPSTA